MDTFSHVQKWYTEVKDQAENNALIFLIANKKDKEKDREVDRARGEAFVKERGLDGFFETSAKTGENVEFTFMTMARMLFKNHWKAIRE